MGIRCPDGRTLVLYYGKSLSLAKRYELEAKRRSGATRRANHINKAVAVVMAELMDELASWAEGLEAERLEGGE